MLVEWSASKCRLTPTGGNVRELHYFQTLPSQMLLQAKAICVDDVEFDAITTFIGGAIDSCITSSTCWSSVKVGFEDFFVVDCDALMQSQCQR